MEIYISFILLFLGYLAAARAQSQEGFISLDCGLIPEDSTYIESRTELNFTSDAAFVNAGKSGQIKPEYASNFMRPMEFLRSFPDGKRNCYNFNVTAGTRYLILMADVYGNYDDLGVLPSFDLHIGPNYWMTLETQAARSEQGAQLIHVATSDRLQVCLVKNGPTTPIMSSIALRPLDARIYGTSSGSLQMLFRAYLTIDTRVPIRFNNDVHDRTWHPNFRDDWMQVLNTNLNISNDNFYTVPQLVLRTAATPKNASEPLEIPWKYGNDTTQFYFYLHLAEMETLEANETREFDIFLNGEDWFKKSIIPNRVVNTIFTIRPITCRNGECKLQLIRTARSTRPPLVNAIEIYTVVEFPLPETEQNEVEAVNKMKDAYNMSRVDWQGDPCNPPELSWNGLNCSYNKGTDPPRITSLNFSSSKLIGTIASSIQDLTQLRQLDLSNNSLTGEVPDFLADMQLISVINLSGNNLSGLIPQGLLDRENEGLLKLNVEGNPRLHCPSGACKNQSVRKKSKAKYYFIAAIFVLAYIIAVLALLVLRFIIASKKRMSMSQKDESTSANTKKGPQFTYSDVVKMTNDFEKLLGEGGFGKVYEGLDDTQAVAVKVQSEPSDLGRKQFRAEVKILLRVHHKNLVKLVGYCEEGDKLALIYEYMAKGDLEEYLSGEGEGESGLLSWGSRLKILVDAAQGLEYLHNGCKPPIIHRDVKTANILLDSNFQAKLADFGLSKAISAENETQTSTIAGGTLRYMDPECQEVTEKSDVYSFGVVILEMLTRRPVIDRTRTEPHIVGWVRRLKLREGGIRQIVDPHLQNITTNMESLGKAVKLGLDCANSRPSTRPTMSKVVAVLHDLLEAENARNRLESWNQRSRRMDIETMNSVRARTL